MTAMGVERFVVTLTDAKQGKQEERRWRRGEIIKSMSWLKRMNARGYDIWIRPDGEHGMILLGGLNKADVQLLRERGLLAAALVETAREQYQAWVKLSQQPLADSVRGLVAQGVVTGLSQYGTNAVARADGCLAGFTNQQVLMAGERHPFVWIVGADGDVAPAASAYLAHLQQELAKVRTVQRELGRESSRSHGPSR